MASARLLLALNQKSRIAVMQESQVILPRRRRQSRHAFMPGAAYRIKAFALLTPGPKIQMPRHNLAVKQINQHMRRRINPQIAAAGSGRKRADLDLANKSVIDDLRPVEHEAKA